MALSTQRLSHIWAWIELGGNSAGVNHEAAVKEKQRWTPVKGSKDGPWPGGEPPVTFLRTEEGPDVSFPRTIPLIQQLLNATELTQDPAAYSKLVAVLVYTAERAKFATGNERQDWMDLFIDTFKLVHRDIVGDPETALALC